jgi:hypothetical protein
MPFILYEPENYTDEGLAAHGKRIAERLGLTREQIKHLVPEIRNSIAAAQMSLGCGARPLEAEDLDDVRSALRRLTALAQALVDVSNRGRP